ncbi:MAG TPA: DUF6644 family protein [Bryobacteraceae bacterium]|nr:DUF6644 family protein [Bryobacteraceae bacterium]
MSLLSICQWIQQTPTSTGIRESQWVFPIIEATHLLSLAVSVGTIVFVDLRLIGAAMRRQPVSDVIGQLQPWALRGFALMFLSGGLLFWSEPLRCYHSVFFQAKFVVLALLGINALMFHSGVYRSVAAWDKAPDIPLRAKFAGYVSLTLWTSVILLGRGIAYFSH